MGLIPSWGTMFFRSTWNEWRLSEALKHSLWMLASTLSASAQDVWSLFYSQSSHRLSCWPYPYFTAQWQREITFKRLLEEYSPNYLCGSFPAVFIRTMELPTWPYLLASFLLAIAGFCLYMIHISHSVKVYWTMIIKEQTLLDSVGISSMFIFWCSWRRSTGPFPAHRHFSFK